MIGRGLWVRLLLSGAGLLGGCIAVGGSDHRPTKGQELMDLKTALDRGAINQQEYDATRVKIMDR
jgi:hypothetical protein